MSMTEQEGKQEFGALVNIEDILVKNLKIRKKYILCHKMKGILWNF